MCRLNIFFWGGGILFFFGRGNNVEAKQWLDKRYGVLYQENSTILIGMLKFKHR